MDGGPTEAQREALRAYAVASTERRTPRRAPAPGPCDLEDGLPADDLAQLPLVARYFATWRRLVVHLEQRWTLDRDLSKTALDLAPVLRTVHFAQRFDEAALQRGGYGRMLGRSLATLRATREALETVVGRREIDLFARWVGFLPGGQLAEDQASHRRAVQAVDTSFRALVALEAEHRQRARWPDPSDELLAFASSHWHELAFPPIVRSTGPIAGRP